MSVWSAWGGGPPLATTQNAVQNLRPSPERLIVSFISLFNVIQSSNAFWSGVPRFGDFGGFGTAILKDCLAPLSQVRDPGSPTDPKDRWSIPHSARTEASTSVQLQAYRIAMSPLRAGRRERGHCYSPTGGLGYIKGISNAHLNTVLLGLGVGSLRRGLKVYCSAV